MPDKLWVVPAMLVYAGAATWAADRLVASHHQRGKRPWRVSLGRVGAGLWWALLIFAAGFVAARYFERLAAPAEGVAHSVFALVAFLLSCARSKLYLRVQDARLDARAGPSLSDAEPTERSRP